MAIPHIQKSQFLIAGGFSLVIAAVPALAVSPAMPGSNPVQSVASCEPGEDLRGGVCVPVGPDGPQAGIPGNPDLPAVDIPGGSIPCTGANTGECIGLTESGEGREPATRPTSKFGDTPVAP